jgi:sulfatase maturation enzyme AslB (radical SAM superfamily)
MRVGRSSDDIWDQMLQQFEHVEQFYFAGGEPIIMEEHYRILKELDKRKMYHVRLIYNTNFTRTKYKDIDVLELWNKFDSVSIGASLDAEGKRGELMRKGTVWEEVVANRKRMLEVCPQVDFYISSTVGLINALHIPDFHRNWVDQGLLKPQDFNFNLLQFPYAQRIDLLPESYKQKVKEKYEKHLEWLRPLDHLTRATKGYESGVDYMMRRDNSKDIQQFKDTMAKLDSIRGEHMLEVFPELAGLYEKD